MLSLRITRPSLFPVFFAGNATSISWGRGLTTARSLCKGLSPSSARKSFLQPHGFAFPGRCQETRVPCPRSSDFSTSDDSRLLFTYQEFTIGILHSLQLKGKFMDMDLSGKEAAVSQIASFEEEVDQFFMALSREQRQRHPRTGKTLWPYTLTMVEARQVDNDRKMMSGSLSIYRNIIAQERESAGSLQGQDLLKPKYLKSMRILSQLLCESDEEKLKEGLRGFRRLMEANGDAVREEFILRTNQRFRELSMME